MDPRRAPMALAHFFGDERPHVFYAVMSPELIAAIQGFPGGPCPHRTGVPGVPRASRIAQSWVKKIMPELGETHAPPVSPPTLLRVGFLDLELFDERVLQSVCFRPGFAVPAFSGGYS